MGGGRLPVLFPENEALPLDQDERPRSRGPNPAQAGSANPGPGPGCGLGPGEQAREPLLVEGRCARLCVLGLLGRAISGPKWPFAHRFSFFSFFPEAFI